MLYSEYLENKRPYQEDGHIFLLERKHACLFYKPGKGKTYPCIDALLDVNKALDGKAKVLILSTADAIRNMWMAEIEPQHILPENTIMYSFTSAIQPKTKDCLTSIKWDVIIVDECHKIKSHNAKISKLVYILSKKATYTWGLTGTPRANTDIDVFCQFHNMNISGWGDISYSRFVDTCCTIDQKFFRGAMIKTPSGILPKYKAGWETNVAMYSQRIEYSEEDDMPNLTVNEIPFDYTPTEEYKKCEQGVISIGDYESTLTKLAVISKLHQCVNGFLYITDGVEEKRAVHHINRNIKLDWLIKHIIGKDLIVYRFAEDYLNITSELEKHGFTYTDNIDEFKTTDTQCLVIQCSRCESFNLQMCNHIIFYTLDYSYIKYNQMLHRVWRMGQHENVQIDVLIYKGTVESDIWKSVQLKEKLADLFMRIKGGI